jgi:hypothetical protein
VDREVVDLDRSGDFFGKTKDELWETAIAISYSLGFQHD